MPRPAEDKLIGRLEERKKLGRLLRSREPELLAVYGRRRVGKTHLVRSFFDQQDLYFELTGQKDGTLAEQLDNFADIFSARFLGRHRLATPGTWREAFRTLARELDDRRPAGKSVLFFDELPWLASRRSGFLQALDYFWNSWASRRPDVIVVLCGSAASWMINRVVHNKGGLHNRLTDRIRLLPFTLAETEAYLVSRHVHLDRMQILEIYMATGGVPHYLRQVQRGQSAAQAMDSLCFSKDGLLSDEFQRLYASLFDNSDRYVRVVQALAQKRAGLSRTELLARARLTTGGGSSRILEALLESGFISCYVPFGKRANDAVYRLADEYSLFFLTWIRKAPRSVLASPQGGYWLQRQAARAWKAWAGYTFEGICQKHAPQIKRALGIAGVSTTESGWLHRGHDQPGAQIDLLIDRADNCINLCEMKYSGAEFVINKSYAGQLRHKRNLFRARTGTQKTIFITMVTTCGTAQNRYHDELVDQQVVLDDLFQ